MNSEQFRKEIEIKRPKYLTRYKPLMEAISEKLREVDKTLNGRTESPLAAMLLKS